MLRLFRRLGGNFPNKRSISSVLPSRALSITCRGQKISREDLFRYTNGRFLVNEKAQCSRRYVNFNLEQLCAVVASAEGCASPVTAIEKMEGGFSKALLMKREDGTEVIAKIPFPNAGPPMYTTASEVAVLKYVKEHTTVPVPKVLAWSSDSSNPVGAEYIIMEKATGVQLFTAWDGLDGSARLSLIEQLTEIEGQLARIDFPAFGHLYLRHSVQDQALHQKLAPTADPTSSYCVGPSCDRSWEQASVGDKSLDKGPWNTLSQLGIGLSQRESSHFSGPGNLTSASQAVVQLLRHAAQTMELLDSNPMIAQSAKPTLWHTDLHMGNIFVSEKDPSKIVSLIDWQSISISPLFMQVRWPVFLEPPDDYAEGFVKPKLPENFEDLDEDGKASASYKFKSASRTKGYEISTYFQNRAAYDARRVPRVFKELFIRCGEVHEEGIVALRACLIELSQTWEELRFPGPCPMSFTEEQIKAHDIEFEEYLERHRIQKFAREYLDTDTDGWISPEIDFNEKLEQNRAIFELMVQKLAAETTREELVEIWPFSEALGTN
ncbi:hypothetical protein EJ08DRAFT_270470 [Tothia fuscella]|uniref:Altered inheritance of mitochondria protein 9, mitochondrial n=1 Tax=Tothia fuscella TaxID=1048955 RepID=A0A9P4NQS9_9PEZI|nr:hypothetical protein EJ08DRAFT_270470 [Tothia fuscella]